MKLALLGLDDQTLAIARAAGRGGAHHVVAVADIAPESVADLATAIGANPQPIDWESLVLGSEADAVIVAGDSDEAHRADQLRKLVQAGIPLLVAHPALESMLIYYELGMIQEELRSVLMPYLPWRWHPATEQLRELIALGAASAIGQVGQATFERHMRDRQKRAVLAQFARDVDLIRDAYGDITRVAALGSPADPATYSNLGVQMSGPEAVACRWSVSRADRDAFGCLTVSGADGTAVLRMPDDGPWTWEVRRQGDVETENFNSWDAETVALELLETAIASPEANESRADWASAARSVELAEAVERSLARGRVIELHNEDFTDIGTFKGTMTSLGCGLLVGILGLVFGVAIIGALIHGWRSVLSSWPYLLVASLILFLLVQLALKLVIDSERPGEADGPEREHD